MEELEKKLGYTFRDPELLRAALYHSSYANEHRSEGIRSNERLEFLGDAVLGFVSAEHLFKKHPELPEGDLTRIRAAEGAHVVLVQVQLLGNRARRWDAVAIEQGTSARVEQVRIELGGSVVACGARTLLNHNKCEYDLDAVYFGHSNDVLDFNDVSVHTGRDTLCEMHTAGVLTGSADKILRGTVDFQRGAKRGVGHESEDVLLFSPSARNRTAPLILCGEEEVEGQHAASVGRLDENKLYYLRSRGLSESQARRLMVDARFAPAIDKIPLDSLQDEVRENVARRLNDELDG